MQDFLGTDEFGFSIKYKAGELLFLGRVASGVSHEQMLLASSSSVTSFVCHRGPLSCDYEGSRVAPECPGWLSSLNALQTGIPAICVPNALCLYRP